MEVILKNKQELLLIAETEFEKSFCELIRDKKFVATLKTGMSPADVVGIKLVPELVEEEVPLPEYMPTSEDQQDYLDGFPEMFNDDKQNNSI
jgi:hypothetical protein